MHCYTHNIYILISLKKKKNTAQFHGAVSTVYFCSSEVVYFERYVFIHYKFFKLSLD